jgi:hypothetical protein
MEAKVREELRRQIAVLNAQDAAENPQKPASQPASVSAPASNATVLPGSVIEPPPGSLGGAPKPSGMPPAETAPIHMAGLSPEDEQKVRDALHKAEAESEAQPTAPASSAAPAGTAAPVGRLSPEDEQKVRETLHQAEADMEARDKAAAQRNAAAELAAKQARDAQLAAERKAAEDKAAADKAAADKAAAESAALHQSLATPETPSPAAGTSPPAPMAAGSKEQRLFDLLQLYKADKISPAEYHQQRAKIVAGP